ncbi:MAG: hypothetical protein JST85_01500 [Acidobacteria bacterium]|nr:hypothetical protein [Acidobacteriota bacterium]
MSVVALVSLIGGSIVLVLVTYGYLLLAWRRLNPKRNLRRDLLSVAGSLVIDAATAFCFIPPPTVDNDVLKFEASLIGSVSFLLIIGLAVYLLRKPQKS